MRWIDLHLVYLLVPMLLVAGFASGFGQARPWLALVAAAVAQFPLWTRVGDRARGGHGVLPYVLANEALIAVLCGGCWLAAWALR